GRLSVGQFARSLVDRDFVIGGIDLKQRLPGRDFLIVVDIDAYDSSADPGANGADVGVDLSVVRGFAGRYPGPHDISDGCGHNQKEADSGPKPPPCFRFFHRLRDLFPALLGFFHHLRHYFPPSIRLLNASGASPTARAREALAKLKEYRP